MNNDKERQIEEMDGERYLWEFPLNLLREPRRVKVQKETEKCYWLDKVVNRRISKVENPNNPDWVGVSTYNMFFRTEDSAKQAYEKLKEARRLANEAIRHFADKTAQIEEMEKILFLYHSDICYDCECIKLCKAKGYGNCGFFKLMAESIYDAGYGNIKEFAERLKEIAKGQGGVCYDVDIDNILSELYGESK